MTVAPAGDGAAAPPPRLLRGSWFDEVLVEVDRPGAYVLVVDADRRGHARIEGVEVHADRGTVIDAMLSTE